MAQSLFPPYPDPVVEEDRRMRRSWVGFFQQWVAAWDALLADTGTQTAAITALQAEVAALPVIQPWVVPLWPAGTITTSGGAAVTPTPPQSQVVSSGYKIIDDQMFLFWTINNLTLGAGTIGDVLLTIPQGFRSVGVSITMCRCYDLGVPVPGGGICFTTGDRFIHVARNDGAAWTSGSSGFVTQGMITFQIVP